MIVVWLWLSPCFEFMPVISRLRLHPIFCDDLFEQPPRLCHSPYRIESWITPSNLGMTFNYCIYLAHSKGRRLPFSKATHQNNNGPNYRIGQLHPTSEPTLENTSMKNQQTWNNFLDSIEMIEPFGSVPQKNPTNENGTDIYHVTVVSIIFKPHVTEYWEYYCCI